MVICGQEFDFSALNANDIDRVETAQRHMEAASDREKQRQHTGIADVLRGQCRLLMNFLDEALGEGASERLGLDGNDFGACKHVMDKFTKAISAEQASMNLAAAVPMNREQRRAQAKKNRHKPPVSYPAQSASRSEVFAPQLTPAAQMVERVDKAARRKQLLAELSALENG
jgi:hypothetical protein